MIEKVTLRLDPDSGRLVPADGSRLEDLNPKAMMLYAAASCSGLTALMIMQKSQVVPTSFEISFSGELSTDTVRAESVFLSFHVFYNIGCTTGEDQIKAKNAATLAHEKYCGLVKMLSKIGPVTHEVAVMTTGQ